jgi:hypothetical protein
MSAAQIRPFGPRLALAAFVIATAAVHGTIAWLSPLQGDDWGHRVWSVQHAGESAAPRALAWLGTHFTTADGVGFLLAHSTVVHTILTPLVGLALLFGVFAVAMRRLPRADDWDDVLGLVMISALIWIAAPRAGLVWFHRPYAASQVWSAAIAVWVLAPYRCGWRVRGAWLPVLAIAALLAGTSTRQIGAASAIAIAVMVRAVPPERRARWMWIGLGAIWIGAVAGFFNPPFFEALKFYKRGVEMNFQLFGLALREGGEAISLIAALVLGSIVLRAWRPARVPPLGTPDVFAGHDGLHPREMLRWLASWFGVAVLALFGPRYSEALLFAPALILAGASLPIVRAVTRSGPIRAIVAAIAVGANVIPWAYAVPVYVQAGAEYRDRMAALAAAPKYSVATVATYTQVAPTFMFYGEDWGGAAGRENYAVDLFHLRDIELAPDFRHLELNPHVEVQLTVDGVPDAQLRAAVPPFWGRTVLYARAQFGQVIRKLQATVDHPFTARLAATNIDFPQRAGRPLLVAWYEHGALFAPRMSRSNLDPQNRFTVALEHGTTAQFTEAWIADHGKAESAEIDGDRIHLRPLTQGVYATVLCNSSRCFVADAFVPRF